MAIARTMRSNANPTNPLFDKILLPSALSFASCSMRCCSLVGSRLNSFWVTSPNRVISSAINLLNSSGSAFLNKVISSWNDCVLGLSASASSINALSSGDAFSRILLSRYKKLSFAELDSMVRFCFMLCRLVLFTSQSASFTNDSNSSSPSPWAMAFVST